MTNRKSTAVAVVYLGEISTDTGARTYLQELLGPLCRDPRLHVVAHIGDPKFSLESGCDVRLHRFPKQFTSTGRVLAEAILTRRLARQGYDVLLGPFNALPAGWRGASVVVQHNLLGGRGATRQNSGLVRSLYRRRAVRTAVRNASATIAVSRHMADVLSGWYPEVAAGRIHAIPLAPARRLLRDRREAVGREAQTLLMVNAVWSYKRVDQGVRAIALLAERFADVRLDVAGPIDDATRDSLSRLAAKLGVDHRVRLLGNVSHCELADRYATATALLALSEIESFGLPIVEAMALGLPVVARRIPAFEEVGGDAPLWIAENAGPSEIADRITLLLDDPGLRSERSDAGVRRAACYSWDETARRTADVLINVATERSSAVAQIDLTTANSEGW